MQMRRASRPAASDVALALVVILAARCCAGFSPPPIRPGAPRSASSGTTRARGSTTRATRRCSARGRRTSGTRCTSRRSSPASSTCRSRCSASGVWQARLVSELSGLASVVLLAFGVRRLAGRDAGLIAGALLATNYVYVMWNRAALMEGSMVAFIVAAWYCYVRAQTQPLWGVARRGVRAAGVFHQGGRRLLRRRARRRRAAPPSGLAASSRAAGRRAGRLSRRWPVLPSAALVALAAVRACRTGPTTSSTTGRCR